MRLIDADVLIKQLKSSSAYNDYEWAMYADGFIEDIENAPSIDIEPKHGEWEEKETFHNADDNPIIEEWQSARCSVCGKYHTTPYMYYFNEYNFCPNCGADMREREGE